MTQAEMGFTGESAGAPTGFFAQTSRRPKISPDRGEWQASMQRYRQAKAAADAFDWNTYQPGCQAVLDAGGIYAPFDLEMQMEHLRDIESAAEMYLMQRVPAPDLAALRWKLDRALLVEEGQMVGWAEDYTRQTIADVARLLGAAA